MIAIYRYGALGDIAASLPVVKAMKGGVKFVGSKVAKELMEDEGVEVEVLKNKNLSTLLKTALKLKKEGIEELIDLQNNDRSKLFRLFFKTYTNQKVSKTQNATAIFYEIAKKSGKVKELDTSFSPKPKEYIVLNSGSSAKWRSKRLPFHKWREFSKILYERFELPFILTGDKTEVEYVNEVAKHLVGKVEVVAGKTSIKELKALLNTAFLTVSTDSAPMHISAVLKTPTIGIFGATNWVISAPFGAWSVALFDKNLSLPQKNNIEVKNYYEGVDLNEGLKKLEPFLMMVEHTGIEPVTSTLPAWRSPS